MIAPDVSAQRQKIKNLQDFDFRRWHFGFSLGYNRSSFFVETKPDFSFTDSLLVLEPFRQPGFNLGIVSQLHMTKNWGLRFIPALSFQERSIQYTFLDKDGKTSFVERRIESTYLDFPINLKYRTDRVNNFAAYLVAGGKYSIDMASQENVSNNNGLDAILKINRHDYSAQVGAGFDFFLEYFKFGLELKMSLGFPNVLLDDDSRYSSPLQSLRTRGFLVSFLFEG
jgi:hypothetical protein